MSKTIIIQKNGVAQTLTVDKLRLPKYGGGTEDWLPADGKNLVKIVVKQNGTYKASDFGAYGISEVKVACTLSGGSATSAAVEKAIKTLRNPCPAEGGLARNMSAHHLETLLSTTGSCQWVPEAEVSLGTKYINVDNRTYRAANDGKYGWSQVTVSGISITQDGNTITHTDGEGTTTYTLPTYIQVEHPPLKFEYADGEAIDFFDMLVKAYNEDGTVWTDANHPDGVIPLEELILPVRVADLSQVTGYERDVTGTDLNAPVFLGLLEVGMKFGGLYVKEISGDIYGMAIDQGTTQKYYVIASYSPGYVKRARSNGSHPSTTHTDTLFQYNGEECYVGLAAHTNNTSTDIPMSAAQPMQPMPAIGIALLGTGPVGGEGDQYIPVQWARPWDGEVLEDGFYITVLDSGFGGAEGGGGQTSGGGAGRDH